MSREINRRLDILNLSEDVNTSDGSNPLNVAFENLDIKFNKINEEELELVLKGELDKKAKTQQKINNEILRY